MSIIYLKYVQILSFQHGINIKTLMRYSFFLLSLWNHVYFTLKVHVNLELATFQVLNMDTVWDNAGLYALYYNLPLSVLKLFLC